MVNVVSSLFLSLIVVVAHNCSVARSELEYDGFVFRSVRFPKQYINNRSFFSK